MASVTLAGTTRGPTDAPIPGAEARTRHGIAHQCLRGPIARFTTRGWRLRFGASLTVPFGAAARSDERQIRGQRVSESGRRDPALAHHGGGLTFIYLTGGHRLPLGPLSLGVTGNLISSSFKNSQAKNFGDGYPNAASEGQSALDVSGWNGSFGRRSDARSDARSALALGLLPRHSGARRDAAQRHARSHRRTGNQAHLPVTFDTALPDIIRIGARFKPVPTFRASTRR